MKVLLCNDTATKSHIGCQAVSDAHARMLGRLGHKVHKRFFVGELRTGARSFSDIVGDLEKSETFLSALSEVDVVVVNGEGTIHDGGGLELLAALHIAKKRKKATLLVNSLFEAVDVDPEIINSFDHFSVRDVRSYQYACSRGLRCVQRFDSIVAANFSGPDQRSDERIAVTDWTKSSEHLVGDISSRMLDPRAAHRSSFFPLHCTGARANWRSAVASLSRAKAVVTSRHHGVYLAILAGVPVIPLQGNTWKVPGLLESFATPLALSKSYEDVRSVLASLDRVKVAVAKAKEQLLEAGALQHFSMLGRGSDSTGEEEEIARLSRDVASRPHLLRRDAELVVNRRKKEKKSFRANRSPPFWARLFSYE